MSNGKKEFKLWLDWKLHKRFKSYAFDNGHSMSWYLTGYIKSLVEGKRGRGHRKVKRVRVEKENPGK